MSYEEDKQVIAHVLDVVNNVKDADNIEAIINSLDDKELPYLISLCTIIKNNHNLNKINAYLLSEITSDLTPSINIKLDSDGNILLIKKDNVSFMDIYDNSHKLLQTYENTSNINGIKYELCKLFYMNSVIESKILHASGIRRKLITSTKRDNAIKSRAFILNDFKKYLNFVCSKENGFNFSKYFSETKFGKSVMKFDKKTITGISKLTATLLSM